jgi:retinol dehydrogenase 12
VKQQTGNSNIDCIRLDLGDLASVKEFSEAYKAKYPKVNHLGHMFLTYQLLPLVKKSEGGRIVVLSSKRHMFGSVDWSDLQYEKKPFNGARAYEQAKIANVLFARELAKKLKSQGSDIVVSSVHPGVIKTELHRDGSIVLRTALTIITALFGKNVSQGVQTTLYGAVSSDLKDKSGHYLADCQITPPNAKEVSDESAKKMWDISCKLLSLPEDW